MNSLKIFPFQFHYCFYFQTIQKYAIIYFDNRNNGRGFMSVLKRSEVPVMETWNLDDLFTSEQAFDAAIDEVKAMASEIEVTLKGKIVDVTSAIKAISSYENLYKKLIPISTYASLAHSVDQTSVWLPWTCGEWWQAPSTAENSKGELSR